MRVLFFFIARTSKTGKNSDSERIRIWSAELQGLTNGCGSIGDKERKDGLARAPRIVDLAQIPKSQCLSIFSI